MSLLLPALLASLAVQAGTATDAEGRELTVKAPQCLVVLGASVAETVHALGHGDKVCASDASVATFGPLAKTVRLPYHRQLSAEGVLAQGTDLVLADAASGPPTAIEQIRTASVPVFMVDRTATVAGAQERAKTLGALLDADGEALAARIGAEVAEAQKVAVPDGQRVLFIYARGGGTIMVGGQKTAADEMIRLAGAQNALSGLEGFVPLTAEAVVGAQPTALLVTTKGLDALGGESGLRGQPGISLLGDVPVIAVEDLILLGFGPRTAAGVRALREGLGKSQ